MQTTIYSRRDWLRAGAGLAAMLALTACGAGAQGAAGTSGSDASTTAAAGTVSLSDTSTTAAATEQTTVSSAMPAATTEPASSSAVLNDTTAVSTTPTAPVSTTGAAATTSTSAAAPTAASSHASTARAAAAAPARGVKLTLAAAGNQASYQVQEQLAGHDVPSQAIGRTSAVSGAIVLDASGKIVPAQSKLELDLRTLKSDQSMRDHYIQRDPLQTSQYPTATFVPQEATGMPWPLPASGTARFTLAGDMTVHGTTKAMTWAVTAAFAPDTVTGSASAPFTFTGFGMQPPHTMIALSVQDSGTLGLQFTATRATA